MWQPLLLGYGMICFSARKISSTLFLLATFVNPLIGMLGFLGNATANLTARLMHVDDETVDSGIFGPVGILTGLVLGLYLPYEPMLIPILLVGSAFAVILQIVFMHYFARWDLPVLSIPFVTIGWLVLLVFGDGDGIEISHAKVEIAFVFLQNINFWLGSILPVWISTYLENFGTIFFQTNVFSGLLVIFGLAFHSRLSFLYAVWGGFVGMIIYLALGGDPDDFFGLNYLLTALALGGFFIVSNFRNWIYVTFAIVITVILSESMGNLLEVFDLPVLVFPFNVIVLLFLFPLKSLQLPNLELGLVPVPLSVVRSPEKNRRWFKNYIRIITRPFTEVALPFNGFWSVSQGVDGDITHKGKGRFAWDFVVEDELGHQAGGFGTRATDFYAFGLPVLAPADGLVVSMRNHIDDNAPQTMNRNEAWGNFVVIDHGNGEFSELSHFKKDSVSVQIGEPVKRGQVIGNCGNSGRSPYPHIHFQNQKTAELASQSFLSRFAPFVRKNEKNNELVCDDVPKLNDKIATLSGANLQNIADYLPLEVGAKWIFQKNGNRKTQNSEIWKCVYDNFYDEKRLVVDGTKYNGLLFSMKNQIFQSLQEYEFSRFSRIGLSFLHQFGAIIPTQYDSNLFWTDGKFLPQEMIKVPAGKFRTIPLEFYKKNGEKLTIHLAREIGFTKVTVTNKKGDAIISLQLENFRMSKDEEI